MAEPSPSTLVTERSRFCELRFTFWVMTIPSPQAPGLDIVALIQPVDPVPVLENVQGLDPWDEFLVILPLVLQFMVAPLGRPVTE